MVFWSVLRLLPDPLARVSNACSAPRSTVVTLSTPQTSWLSSFPASFTLPLWVPVRSLRKSAVVLRTNAIHIGTGIAILYLQYRGYMHLTPQAVAPHFGIPYLSISVSLNVLLTLMIVIRIVLHGTRSPAGIRGSFKAASTMFIESCALFAMTSLVVVGGLVAAGSSSAPVYYPGIYVVDIFFPILAETQVRAFPRPQSPGQLSNVPTDRTGDRSAAHHSTGRQRERIDEPHYHH